MSNVATQNNPTYVKLTPDYCKKLMYEVQINLVKHNLAAKHFETRHFWVFSFPQAVLTAIASILAFIPDPMIDDDDSNRNRALFENCSYERKLEGNTTSTTTNTTTNSYHDRLLSFSQIAGILSAIAVFFQTVSGFKYYDKRADRHKNTAIQLRDLRDELKILQMKLEAKEKGSKKSYAHKGQGKSNTVEVDTENAAVNEEGNVAGADVRTQSDSESQSGTVTNYFENEKEKEFSESFDAIQKRYQQCLLGCSSYVPLQIGNCFHGLASNLELILTETNLNKLKQKYGDDENNQDENFEKDMLMAKAVDILADQIMASRFFPMFLPQSKRMVRTTTVRFTHKLAGLPRKVATVLDDDYEKPKTLCTKFYNLLIYGETYPKARTNLGDDEEPEGNGIQNRVVESQEETILFEQALPAESPLFTIKVGQFKQQKPQAEATDEAGAATPKPADNNKTGEETMQQSLQGDIETGTVAMAIEEEITFEKDQGQENQ